MALHFLLSHSGGIGEYIYGRVIYTHLIIHIGYGEDMHTDGTSYGQDMHTDGLFHG